MCIRFVIFPSVFQIRKLFRRGGNGGIQRTIKKLSSRILYLFFSLVASSETIKRRCQCQVKREVFWDASKRLYLISIRHISSSSFDQLIIRIFSSRTYEHPWNEYARESRNGGGLRNNLDVRLRNNSGTRMINAFSIHLNAPLSPKRDIGAAPMHRLIVQCLRIVAIVAD